MSALELEQCTVEMTIVNRFVTLIMLSGRANIVRICFGDGGDRSGTVGGRSPGCFFWY